MSIHYSYAMKLDAKWAEVYKRRWVPSDGEGDPQNPGQKWYDEPDGVIIDDIEGKVPPRFLDMSSWWVCECVRLVAKAEDRVKYWPATFTLTGLVDGWLNKGRASKCYIEGIFYYNVVFKNIQLHGFEGEGVLPYSIKTKAVETSQPADDPATDPAQKKRSRRKRKAARNTGEAVEKGVKGEIVSISGKGHQDASGSKSKAEQEVNEKSAKVPKPDVQAGGYTLFDVLSDNSSEAASDPDEKIDMLENQVLALTYTMKCIMLCDERSRHRLVDFLRATRNIEQLDPETLQGHRASAKRDLKKNRRTKAMVVSALERFHPGVAHAIFRPHFEDVEEILGFQQSGRLESILPPKS